MQDKECKKRKYLDEATANGVLDSFKKRRRNRNRFKKIKRAYKCTKCGFWHLTSKELRSKPLSKKGRKKDNN